MSGYILQHLEMECSSSNVKYLNATYYKLSLFFALAGAPISTYYTTEAKPIYIIYSSYESLNIFEKSIAAKNTSDDTKQISREM